MLTSLTPTPEVLRAQAALLLQQARAFERAERARVRSAEKAQVRVATKTDRQAKRAAANLVRYEAVLARRAAAKAARYTERWSRAVALRARIVELIPVGRDAAVSALELARVLGVRERVARQCLAMLRGVVFELRYVAGRDARHRYYWRPSATTVLSWGNR